MSEIKKERREPILNPVSRISEIIFGLLMALSFTCTLSAATAGREEVRTMMFAALGCNLAWGLVDAVMYIIVTLTDRARTLTLLHRVRTAADANSACDVLTDALPEHLGAMIGADGLESIRRRLVAQAGPARGHLSWDDFKGAFGVFLLVVLVTFPVVIPFMLVADTPLALRVSNAVAVILLFTAGFRLGSYAGLTPWRCGCAMAAIGVCLVATTIALGG